MSVNNPATWLGKNIVGWLTKEKEVTKPPLCDFERIRYEVRPCDVILVEGRSRVAEIIKTITQSPWTHSALYIGRIHDIDDEKLRNRIRTFYDGSPHDQLVIEAWLGKGTVVNPLSKYTNDTLRICRPAGLSRQDAQRVMRYTLHHLGFKYDVRQLLDLARFLFPYGIIPRRWRSSLFQRNAGHPTRSVCSSMIAAAFAWVKFPVLPELEQGRDGVTRMVQRNARLCTPRDFDYSPYFDIIKCAQLDFGHHSQYRDLPWDRRNTKRDDSANDDQPASELNLERDVARVKDLEDDLLVTETVSEKNG